jgi:hypothetical protein
MNDLILTDDLTRYDLVDANVNALTKWLAPLTPANRIALLDVLGRAVEQADKVERIVVKDMLLKSGCSLDAGNGRFEVALVKARVQYEYPSQEHAAIVAKIDEYKAMLKDLEKGMQKTGQAVAQTEQEYQVRLTEKKLTKEGV